MRILAVTDAERWFNYHIVGSLQDLGHDVQTFVYGAGAGDFYGVGQRGERRTKNQKLLDIARQMKSDGGLDLIFCFVYDDFLTVDNARALARLGAPMVNYNVDMTNQWYRQLRTGSYFSYVLCAQRVHMDAMDAHGIRTLYFPMAARLKPGSGSQETDFRPSAPVTFLGTPMPYRVAVLAALERAGIKLGVYGSHWQQNRYTEPQRSVLKTASDVWHYLGPRVQAEGANSVFQAWAERFKNRGGVQGPAEPSLSEPTKHGALPDEAVDVLFRRSLINLGFTRIVDSRLGIHGKNQVKLRDFEVPLAGGFYLVEEAPDHAELFDVGREIVTWKTPEELIEKIRYYSQRDTERTAIAKAGEKRALRDHTWLQRFEGLFRLLGVS